MLCDPTTLRPIAAIELDDATHLQPYRIERDAFVDDVLASPISSSDRPFVSSARTNTFSAVRTRTTMNMPNTHACPWEATRIGVTNRPMIPPMRLTDAAVPAGLRALY